MNNPISGLIFFLLLAGGFVVGTPVFLASPAIGSILGLVWFFVSMIIASGVQIADQWEKGVVFQLGRFSRVAGPGLFFLIPVVEEARKVDMRVLTMDIPPSR